MAIRNSIRTATRRWSWLFLGPVVVAFAIGFVWPFIQGIYLSFCKFKTTSNAQFIGVDNYGAALADSGFQYSFWYTALTAVVSLVLINVIAFLVAYLLTQKLRGSNIFRTVFFMPNLIGGIVLGYIWSMIFDGILAAYSTSILLDTTLGFWGLIILMCWQQIGYMMIIYIAGLNNVSPDLIEAAQVDGADRKQTLFRIKIPLIMPSVTICTFLTLTNGFKMFDQNLSLTGGEPAKASQLLALNIYDTYYARSGPQWKGIGQAKAVIFFLIVVVISLIQLRTTTSREVQA